jgi:hypothetical protein
MKIKLMTAGIGATAAIAMGGLGVAFSGVGSAQPEPVPSPTTPDITTGQTSTQCVITEGTTTPGMAPAEETPTTSCAAPPEPSVPVATPEITPTSAEPG